MIRFGRLADLASQADFDRLEHLKQLFRAVFPREAEYAEEVERLLRARPGLDFDVAVLTAENARHELIGFAIVFFFPEIRYGFLDYIGSDPRKRARGIGRAIYEVAREYLTRKHAKGLFLEAPPDDPRRVSDRDALRASRERLRFYERFGVRPIVGTKWDNPPVPPPYPPPYLLYDDLGRPGELARRDARKAAERILTTRYGKSKDDADVKAIVASFGDDPVRVREPKFPAKQSYAVPSAARLRPIKVVSSPHHEIHHVRERGYVERPARVKSILRALEVLPIEHMRAARTNEDAIRAVHDGKYVSYFQRATANLEPDITIYPQVFPIRRPDREPRELAIRAGYYCIDTFTPLSRGAYAAARAAVDCAMAGAKQIERGETLVYAICRPPGHHAETRSYGGFCYFNNAAIAAHELTKRGRVALLDIDFHHGNGQQEIFYRRADVLTISIHGKPRDHYPYFAGFEDEKGEGEGEGYNLNLILKDLAGDDAYLAILQRAVRRVREFEPTCLVLSLGFDIMRGDPTGNFGVTSAGMNRIGETIGAIGMPVLVVQEGGYALRNLTLGCRAFFTGLSSAWYR